ncbi:hypothetical protein CYMTET_14143 [Cymbomonas tetramitiformis]|uniref:Uncharacterized protein n=1 Tax=Cymbomonas tetramitiformis TaxID=36881 RepID=A0AAE0GH12_9CHLO|nr:hypothetical protein CYMTET_14143 [Cymbomonas tetramitiformis]
MLLQFDLHYRTATLLLSCSAVQKCDNVLRLNVETLDLREFSSPNSPEKRYQRAISCVHNDFIDDVELAGATSGGATAGGARIGGAWSHFGSAACAQTGGVQNSTSRRRAAASISPVHTPVYVCDEYLAASDVRGQSAAFIDNVTELVGDHYYFITDDVATVHNYFAELRDSPSTPTDSSDESDFEPSVTVLGTGLPSAADIRRELTQIESARQRAPIGP